MADQRSTGMNAPSGEEVRLLEQRALHLQLVDLANRPEGFDHRIGHLCDVFLGDDVDQRRTAVAQLFEDGVSREDIIDFVLPDVSRAIGKMWDDSEISFAEVSIGAARVQEAVRLLITRGEHERTGDARIIASNGARRRILMIVPRPETHTLGAFVAADQLRRLGFEVDMALDRHPNQIIAQVRTRRYVMVGITVAGRRCLGTAREFVDTVRASVTRVTPIVLGGSLLDTGYDFKQATGVDHLASDVRTALKQCNLSFAESAPPLLAMAGRTG